MIIQCEKCRTKFRLDENRIRGVGAKVRCAKCRHEFIVRKESAPKPGPDFASVLAKTATAGVAADMLASSDVERFETSPEALQAESFTSSTPAFSFSQNGGESAADRMESAAEWSGLTATPVEKSPTSTETYSSIGDAFSFEDLAVAEPETSSAAGTAVPDDERFAQPPVKTWEEAEAIPTEGADALDGLFAFGEVPAIQDSDMQKEIEVPGFGKRETAPSRGGFDSLFGDLDLLNKEEPPAGTHPAFEIPFDLPPEEEEQDAIALATSAGAGESGEDSLDFDELDFGDIAPPPTTTTPAAATAFDTAPAAPSGISQAASSPDSEGSSELLPSPIASRRKGSSLTPVAIIGLAVLFIIALAGGGFYLLKEGPTAFRKLGLDSAPPAEEGTFVVRNTSGKFLTNKEAGEVLVLRGEAVNNFKKPRASVQVKASIFTAKGEVLSHKTVFCGNSLTDDQVKSQPLAKLDTAMNNQFGDSLANLGVEPGKAIPFVVVFTNVPKEAVDFGVEVVSSTAAGQ